MTSRFVTVKTFCSIYGVGKTKVYDDLKKNLIPHELIGKNTYRIDLKEFRRRNAVGSRPGGKEE